MVPEGQSLLERATALPSRSPSVFPSPSTVRMTFLPESPPACATHPSLPQLTPGTRRGELAGTRSKPLRVPLPSSCRGWIVVTGTPFSYMTRVRLCVQAGQNLLNGSPSAADFSELEEKDQHSPVPLMQITNVPLKCPCKQLPHSPSQQVWFQFAAQTGHQPLTPLLAKASLPGVT